MTEQGPWQDLGLTREEAADPAMVRRAYARALKEHRPDRDPDGFRRIRSAYEALLTGAAERPPPSPPAVRREPAEAPPSPSQPQPQLPHLPNALLRLGDWDGLDRWLQRRRSADAKDAPLLDIELARCFALVEPAVASELAQRAFLADRYAIDPWMERLLAAGSELAGATIEDRRLAARAVLEALPPGDDPVTALRLRALGYRVGDPGLRTALVAAAAGLDRSIEAQLAVAREQNRAERGPEVRRLPVSGRMAIVLIVAALLIASLAGISPSQPPAPRSPVLSERELEARAERLLALRIREIQTAQGPDAAAVAVADAPVPGGHAALVRILGDPAISRPEREALARAILTGGNHDLCGVVRVLMPRLGKPAAPPAAP